MGRFDDIVNHKYIKSPKRKHMTMTERAAQFGAFRAVVGHEDALHEEARLTDVRTELDEYEKQEINGKLNFLAECINEKPNVSVTYFVPDEKKSGGSYKTASGVLTKIKEFERVLIVDGAEIPIDDIFAVESEKIEGDEEFY